MRCAGCVSRVKVLLEAEPPVQQASVNLATETAMVRVVLPPPPLPPAGAAPPATGARGGATGGGSNGSPASVAWPAAGAVGATAAAAVAAAAVDMEQGWAPPPRPAPGQSPHSQQLTELGTALASLLTAAGYAATPRDPDASTSAAAKVAAAKRAERLERLARATRRLGLAWLLASVCLAHHGVHWLGAAAPGWMRALCTTPAHAAVSALVLLGPGREIVVEGFRGLLRGAPDMNSLVALGAAAAYGTSLVAAGLPALGWRTFFEEPAMLLGVVLLGRTLEERAKLQAGADMAALQGLLPQRARLQLGAESAAGGGGGGGAGVRWREVPAEGLAAGDVVVVLPGDRVPVDGVVVGGRSTVDESALAGEPLPVTKTAGEEVTAGTVNLDGSLSVRAVHSGGDTAVADIVRLVEAAQSRAAPVQRLADRVAGSVRAVHSGGDTAVADIVRLVEAAQSRAAPVQRLADRVAGSLQLACNVLVVACPCALGLAAPTAVLVGTGVGARRGLLIRGGDVLEAASGVDTVVFDKTGTLTAGKPAVVGVAPAPGAAAAVTVAADAGARGQRRGHERGGEGEGRERDAGEDARRSLLLLSAAVERGSSHPLAVAIRREAVAAVAAGGGAPAPEAEEGSFVQEPGSGVTARVGGRLVSVGTMEWVTRSGRPEEQQQQAESRQASGAAAGPGPGSLAAAAGGSGADSGAPAPSPAAAAAGEAAEEARVRPGHILVHVGLDGQLVGSIEMADELRPEAAATVAALQRMGLRPLMLTGDAPAAAAAMAAAAGIPAGAVFAGVKPAGKADVAAGRRVAMVGDGVNDAAALAQADVGIAMGGGVDAASEVADVVLLGDRIPQVLDVLQLSRATLRKIRQNMWWAFAYNLVGIPLAAGALLPAAGLALTPSISGAMMGVSSLAVMANSLLLQLEGGRRAATGQQQRQREKGKGGLEAGGARAAPAAANPAA
eukprot:scaffold5.g769.t1